MDCVGEIFGVRCRKRVWVYSERVFGLFRGEETLPRKGVACSMERVRGGRIGSLRPVSERALAGRGSPALVSGAACGAGRLCTGRLHVRGIPAAPGFAACCRPQRRARFLWRKMPFAPGIVTADGGGLRAGYSGRWPGRAGRRSPLSVPCGVGSGIDPLKQGPAGAGRQLPLYNYDSGCFIFDTMAESRINTLPKPDVIFFQDIIPLKNNCYCNYQTGRVRFYCAGLVYLYF